MHGATAWNSAWGWMRRAPRIYESGLREDRTSDLLVWVCCRPSSQCDRANGILYSDRSGLVFRSSGPGRDNKTGHKQCRRGENFLLQGIQEPVRRGVRLELVLSIGKDDGEGETQAQPWLQ